MDVLDSFAFATEPTSVPLMMDPRLEDTWTRHLTF